MPNWVMNKLVLTGKDANKVADRILSQDKETKKEYMNFNNIDKMPDTLNVICGSCTLPAADYYLAAINPDSTVKHEGYDKLGEREFLHTIEQANACVGNGERRLSGKNEFGVTEADFSSFGGEKAYLKYGKIIVENRINFKASTWYEWSREHWGVKWNASESRVTRETDEVIIYFETPWNGVPGLMRTLGELVQQSDVTIDYDYSEEQEGYMDFHMKMKNGRLVDIRDYEMDSKEAIRHYNEIWGYAG